MNDADIRTYTLSLVQEANGITVSIPWAQRQANGAVIVRVHAQAPHHSAGELLLNETDVIALDPDERPLRTQVRRFWGYSALEEVTPAHMQTARYDVGFRLDVAGTGGHCGLSIALLRTFRPGEGPRAVGGPWAFSFRVADDAEVAAAAEAENTRIEAARADAARQEAVRQETARVEAERREAQRQERARLEAARGERLAAQQPADSSNLSAEPAQRPPRPAEERREGDRSRRPGRFLRPEQLARAEDDLSASAAGTEAPAAPAPALPPDERVTEIVEAAVLGEEPTITPRTARRGRPARAATPAAASGEQAAGELPTPRRAPRRRGAAGAPSEPSEQT